jgi:hypothetical protein
MNKMYYCIHNGHFVLYIPKMNHDLVFLNNLDVTALWEDSIVHKPLALLL